MNRTVPMFLSALVVLLAVLTGVAPSDDKSARFSQWFGQQEIRRQKKKVDGPVGAVVDLILVKGKDISVPAGTNLVTLRDKKISRVSVKDVVVKEDSMYLVGEIQFPENKRSAVYTCDVLITNGPLSGVIIHMRDGHFPQEENIAKVEGPLILAHRMMCIYEVPCELSGDDVDELEVEFEFVKVVVK